MMERRRGQVTVEVILILPFYLMLIFTIMEIGHLSFMEIMLNHVAYETARYASLTAGAGSTCGGPASRAPTLRDYSAWASNILPGVTATPSADSPIMVGTDPQANCPMYDVEIIAQKNVHLIFGGLSGMFLGKDCGGGASLNTRCLTAKVRMPIEQPLFQ